MNKSGFCAIFSTKPNIWHKVTSSQPMNPNIWHRLKVKTTLLSEQIA